MSVLGCNFEKHWMWVVIAHPMTGMFTNWSQIYDISRYALLTLWVPSTLSVIRRKRLFQPVTWQMTQRMTTSFLRMTVCPMSWHRKRKTTAIPKYSSAPSDALSSPIETSLFRSTPIAESTRIQSLLSWNFTMFNSPGEAYFILSRRRFADTWRSRHPVQPFCIWHCCIPISCHSFGRTQHRGTGRDRRGTYFRNQRQTPGCRWDGRQQGGHGESDPRIHPKPHSRTQWYQGTPPMDLLRRLPRTFHCILLALPYLPPSAKRGTTRKVLPG